jgi:hypothetical protein
MLIVRGVNVPDAGGGADPGEGSAPFPIVPTARPVGQAEVVVRLRPRRLAKRARPGRGLGHHIKVDRHGEITVGPVSAQPGRPPRHRQKRPRAAPLEGRPRSRPRPCVRREAGARSPQAAAFGADAVDVAPAAARRAVALGVVVVDEAGSRVRQPDLPWARVVGGFWAPACGRTDRASAGPMALVMSTMVPQVDQVRRRRGYRRE